LPFSASQVVTHGRQKNRFRAAVQMGERDRHCAEGLIVLTAPRCNSFPVEPNYPVLSVIDFHKPAPFMETLSNLCGVAARPAQQVVLIIHAAYYHTHNFT
jgi:hypothetical protein